LTTENDLSAVLSRPEAPDGPHALAERMAVTDVIYRYASTIDRRDLAGLRTTLHDDIEAKYGNGDWIHGGDALVGWIDSATEGTLWQHHLLSVYHVEVVGDRADALVYHTSHQVFANDPATVCVLVARYHNQLTRTPGGWRISRLLFELLWGEQRQDTTGYLESVGGRGPAL
jgi:hypothetical protein